MQARQVAPRHADVGVVGQMPPRVVRHHEEAGEATLADHVSGAPAIGRALHAPVLSDRPQPVGELPQRGPRADPHDVYERSVHDDRRAEQHELHATYVETFRVALADRSDQAADVLEGTLSGQVPTELAVPGIAP